MTRIKSALLISLPLRRKSDKSIDKDSISSSKEWWQIEYKCTRGYWSYSFLSLIHNVCYDSLSTSNMNSFGVDYNNEIMNSLGIIYDNTMFIIHWDKYAIILLINARINHHFKIFSRWRMTDCSYTASNGTSISRTCAVQYYCCSGSGSNFCSSTPCSSSSTSEDSLPVL